MRVVGTLPGSEPLLALLDEVSPEPVLIQRNGPVEDAVLLTSKEYDRIRGEALEDLWSLSERVSTEAQARGLTEEKLNEILAEIKNERRE